MWKLDERVRAKLFGTGFDTIHCMVEKTKHNFGLISSVIHCYDKETNCFKFGDQTVLFGLEDILHITGFPIDGKPVTGKNEHPEATCRKYLLDDGCLRVFKKGKSVKTSNVPFHWLRENFETVPPSLDEDSELDKYVRAYVLYIIGCVIAPDPAGSFVSVMYLPLLEDLEAIGTYAWGAGLLGNLQNSICRYLDNVKIGRQANEISGFVYSILVFALERIPKLRGELNLPIESTLEKTRRFPLIGGWSDALSHLNNNYRKVDWNQILGNLNEDDIVWQPYKRLPVDFLPEPLKRQVIMGMSRTVLLCFNDAVYRRPDLTPRQFGLPNDFVSRLPTGGNFKLEVLKRSGPKGKDWATYEKYKDYNEMWTQRYNNLLINLEEFEELVNTPHPINNGNAQSSHERDATQPRQNDQDQSLFFSETQSASRSFGGGCASLPANVRVDPRTWMSLRDSELDNNLSSFIDLLNGADPTNAGWSGDVLDNIGLQPDTEMDWDARNGNSNSQPTPQPSTLDDPEHEQQVGDEEEQQRLDDNTLGNEEQGNQRRLMKRNPRTPPKYGLEENAASFRPFHFHRHRRQNIIEK